MFFAKNIAEVKFMEKKMKRRSYVRVVSFVAALAAVLVTASICGNVRASKYKRQITLSQQRALTELDGRLREIGTSLKKGCIQALRRC